MKLDHRLHRWPTNLRAIRLDSALIGLNAPSIITLSADALHWALGHLYLFIFLDHTQSLLALKRFFCVCVLMVSDQEGVLCESPPCLECKYHTVLYVRRRRRDADDQRSN